MGGVKRKRGSKNAALASADIRRARAAGLDAEKEHLRGSLAEARLLTAQLKAQLKGHTEFRISKLKAHRKTTDRRDKKIINLISDNLALNGKCKALEQENSRRLGDIAVEREKLAACMRALQETHKRLAQKSTMESPKKRKRKTEIKNLKAQTGRVFQRLAAAKEQAKRDALRITLMEGRTYSNVARDLATNLVTLDIPAAKVPAVIKLIADSFGFVVDKMFGRRAIARFVLEAGIASEIQLIYELQLADSHTLSQDSTSHRKKNCNSRNIAIIVPDYEKEGMPPKIGHTQRFLGIDQDPSHSIDASVAAWKSTIKKYSETANASPLFKKRLQAQYNWNHFITRSGGSNGDHAYNEKGTATALGVAKREAVIDNLGREKLGSVSAEELHEWIGVRQVIMVQEIGVAVWDEMSADEQTRKEEELVQKIVNEIGKEQFDRLPAADQRRLTLFIWCGCCMHKDLNTFKAGCMQLAEVWDELKVPRPCLLANKANAQILRDIIDPGADTTQPMTDDQIAAFESTSRGGVKFLQIAAAIFANKDDKKGQGDRLVAHLSQWKKEESTERSKKKVDRFPALSKNRFGTFGEAASHIIKFLPFYQDQMAKIRWTKDKPGLTNIESNVNRALHDTPTLVELGAMALGYQSISHGYILLVRPPKEEDTNALDLGPLHQNVKDFILKLIDNPGSVIGPDAGELDGSLLAQGWADPMVVRSINRMHDKGNLPCLIRAFQEFLKGTLHCWERFTSEYAPGGLIDTASIEEKKSAWMAATNDVNEGALGSFRLMARNSPSLTLHQLNARLMWKRNNTYQFVKAVFTKEDRIYAMRCARVKDASKLTVKLQRELVEHDTKLADAAMEKQRLRQQRQQQRSDHLGGVTLLNDASQVSRIARVDLIDEQLDAMQHKFGLDDEIPLKSHRGKRADKEKLLVDSIRRFKARGWYPRVLIDEEVEQEAGEPDNREEVGSVGT